MIKKYYLSDFIKYEGFAFHISISSLKVDFQSHVHDFFELVIILSGSVVHVVNGQEFYLKAGDVFVINGDTIHSYKEVNSLRLCNIMFDLKNIIHHFEDLKKLSGFQYLFILEPYYRKEHKFESKLILDPLKLMHVETQLNIMLQEYIEKTVGFQTVIKAHFLSLIAYLSRQFPIERNPTSHKLHLFADSIAFIENNFAQEISVREVATKANFSLRHFIRVFKHSYNITPSDYIIQLKLNYACKLLKNTQLNITQVSLECGFSDISFFSRQFKAKLGMPPSEYRKMYLK